MWGPTHRMLGAEIAAQRDLEGLQAAVRALPVADQLVETHMHRVEHKLGQLPQHLAARFAWVVFDAGGCHHGGVCTLGWPPARCTGAVLRKTCIHSISCTKACDDLVTMPQYPDQARRPTMAPEDHPLRPEGSNVSRPCPGCFPMHEAITSALWATKAPTTGRAATLCLGPGCSQRGLQQPPSHLQPHNSTFSIVEWCSAHPLHRRL
jgi:hypothetical protein